MQNRMRLLMGATALLYVGPLLAGLGGLGWETTPLFLALFLLWLFVLRPQQWPQRARDWLHRYQPWATLGTQAAVQLLLVLLLFGVGRGIGGALHYTASYGASLPLMVSFLAIPIARMVWDPWKAPHLNDYLDEALHNAPDTTTALAERMLAPLAALPDSTEPAEIARHLLAIAPHLDAADLRQTLLRHHAEGRATAAETTALILHSTDPELILSVQGDGPNLALVALPQTPERLAEFARRLTAALTQRPEVWDKSPSVEHLSDLVDRFDNTAAEAPLRDLIFATNAAAPEDGLA
jgi:hypothetical protein